jgi:prephenate dehydratase
VTKEDWQKRLQDARSALERNQMFAEALQTRINSLTTDFVARDDPAQRAAIESERRKALAQLDKVKRDIEDQTKAIADIQEQARRAGVPAGWVR